MSTQQTINVTIKVVGDYVAAYFIQFWDGTTNHVIYSEADGQLITELQVPAGALIGFSQITLRNLLYPTHVTAFLEILRNGVQHGYMEKVMELQGIDFTSAEMGGDWSAANENITINIGYV